MARFCIIAAIPLILFGSGIQAFSPDSNILSRKIANSDAFKSSLPFVASNLKTTPTTQLNEMLTQTELPEKLYFEKERETPKVLGGVKIGLRKLVVVTGASSGLGLKCAATLSKTGKYFVVMACRDVKKGKKGMML